MSKGPDLSAFPIPRKGGARPISVEERPDRPSGAPEERGEGARHEQATAPPLPAMNSPQPRTEMNARQRPLPPIVQPVPSPAVSGQVVATTVKLDEDRYLRLVSAGQPGPGRLKRRSIQEMMVEAIDEWFERRNL